MEILAIMILIIIIIKVDHLLSSVSINFYCQRSSFLSSLYIKWYSKYITFLILYFHFKDPTWALSYGRGGFHIMGGPSDSGWLSSGSAWPVATQLSAKTEQTIQSIHLSAHEAAKKALASRAFWEPKWTLVGRRDAWWVGLAGLWYRCGFKWA